MSLQMLEELTKNLPPFPTKIGILENGWTEHLMECGISKSISLLSKPETSVAWWFNGPGENDDCMFPEHAHPMREWLIVFKGCMLLTVGTEVFELGVGDYQFIPSGVSHKAEFKEDTEYIAITIPHNPDWPE